MIFLCGDTRTKKHVEMIEKLKWGRMLNVSLVKPYLNEPIGFDNGAWRNYKKGIEFDSKNFLNRIKRASHLSKNIILAVTPDIVCGGNKSLKMSNSWIKFLNEISTFKWFLAVQDNMDIKKVEDSLIKNDYKGIFLGGSDIFKLELGLTYSLLAKKYGLKFHYGRCGTKNKLFHALKINADSSDSVIPIFSKKRVIEVATALKVSNLIINDLDKYFIKEV